MKYSYAWLRALSGTTKAPEELAQELTVRAFEVEEVLALSAGLESVVVGQVLEVAKHPDADRLNVAQVDVGEEVPRTIVCGAPNLAVGQKVPVALPGAVLPTPDGKGFAIKKGTIRGVESNGMICAEDELGLGDDHEGIMVLPDDAPVGVPFAQYRGLDDTAMEIDVLPNRAHDCLSHEGVAREIAAMEGRVYDADAAIAADDAAHAQESEVRSRVIPAEAEIQNGDMLTSDIQTDKCLRYTATLITDVDNTRATPDWMRARLHACGVQSISPLVDITNYVMLETGQPLHVFDADALRADGDALALGVRAAHAGEKLTLLDEREVTLTPDDMVITDGARPIALAGVMGGADSGVTAHTTRVVLEAAAFDAPTVRRMRQRHGITSDAAFRFERDLDPNLVTHARARAVQLITAICGGTVTAAADDYPSPVAPWTVTLTHAAIEKLLGTQIDAPMVNDILARLDIAVAENDGTYTCTIPTVRRDLTTPADIIEEVGRLYGYENIAPRPLPTVVAPPEANAQRAFEHRTRDIWTAGGFDEIKSYSFYSEADARAVELNPAHHIALRNPMTEQHTLLRRTLVPALLSAAARNLTHTPHARFFEIARTYEPRQNDLPRERTVLGAAVVGRAQDAQQFFVLKGMVEAYCDALGLSGVTFVPYEAKDDAVALHPSRAALVTAQDGTTLGIIGEATKKALKHAGVKKARVAVAELDLAAVQELAARERFFTPLPKYPCVERDLSMRVGARTRVADVQRVLEDAGGALLADSDLFDLYVNPDTGERSMAFRLRFCAPDRTLTGAEIDERMAQIIAALEASDDAIQIKK